MSVAKTMRTAAIAALSADAEFATYTLKRSWAFAVDNSSLPAWGVFTPDENRDTETFETRRSAVDLQVVVKRSGGDELQDFLDDDADRIEAAVVPSILATTAWFSEVVSIRTQINAEGSKRIGMVQVSIRCVAEIEILD